MEQFKVLLTLRESTEEEHSNLISSMESNMNVQQESYVGTFWYWSLDKKLLFVQKTSSSDIPYNDKGQKTTSRLHSTIWQKEKNRVKGKGLKWDYPEDYTKVPRGRVWQQKDKFVVTVGDWINDYPEAKELILEEFELPLETEFIIDSHWNIGSGWSGDKI